MKNAADNSPFGTDRNASGRFAKGNPGGPGNPSLAELNKQSATLRARWERVITERDVDLAIKTLRQVMRKGKRDSDRVRAAVAMLDRLVGRPADSIVEARLAALEERIRQQNGAPINGN